MASVVDERVRGALLEWRTVWAMARPGRGVVSLLRYFPKFRYTTWGNDACTGMRVDRVVLNKVQVFVATLCLINITPVKWRTQEFVPGGFNKFSWGQRERGAEGGSPLVRGSGGSCNLVQEISFHIAKFS